MELTAAFPALPLKLLLLLSFALLCFGFRPLCGTWRKGGIVLHADNEDVTALTSSPPPAPESASIPFVGLRDEDLDQERDLDLILMERSRRFYDPKLYAREACLLVAVETKQTERNAYASDHEFTFEESMSELSELVGTAGLEVYGVVVQKLGTPNLRTYVGPGKIADIMALVNETNARTIVVDDDLTPKQQLSMEFAFAQWGGADVKVLDRTALILEIFAQHARSREGQLQVELAQLQYRLTRGPSARGDPSSSDVGGKNSGAGFRGPGETKLETDKRMIRDKIVLLKRELLSLDARREQHRSGRSRLGLPVVALVGYTNVGKSSLLNVLSRAGVLAENMLFATLDNTIRKVRLDKGIWDKSSRAGGGSGVRAAAKAENQPVDGALSEEQQELEPIESSLGTKKGQEILVTDTVGFISKLPTDLVAAFRATLDEAKHADVLVHVCDRSSPVWEKQRETVLRELDALGVECPVVELWNKVDALPGGLARAEEVMLEAACVPFEVEGRVLDWVEDSEMQDVQQLQPQDEEDYSGFALLADAQAGGAEGVSSPEHESGADSEDEYGYLSEAAYSNHLASLSFSPDITISEEDVATIAPLTNSAATDEQKGEDFVGRKGGVRGARTKARRISRKTFTVAASVKTGLGFDDFVSTLIDALSLRLKEVDVFVPYNKDDGIVAAIHNQGVVLEIGYSDSGTKIKCRVPSQLRAKLTERGLVVRQKP